MELRIRSAVASDGAACGKVLFDAFTQVATRHGFGTEVTVEYATERATRLLNHPEVFGAVAEKEGRIEGVAFLDERSSIRGVGPIGVEPRMQGKGIGKQLMETVLSRVTGYPGVRVVLDGFNSPSPTLFTSLGFETKQPLKLVRGRIENGLPSGFEVRPMNEGDIEACEELCRAVHGFDRTSELRDALAELSPFVALRDGRMVAYITTATAFRQCHGVAENAQGMQAVISGAARANGGEVEILLPAREAEFLKWATGLGLREVRPLALMARGEYQDPRGCFIPSALY